MKTIPTSAEMSSIREFLEVKGATQCPPAYLVVIAGASAMVRSVPMYDVGLYQDKTKMQRIHAERDIMWKNARFRERLRKARNKKPEKHSRPHLPEGI